MQSVTFKITMYVKTWLPWLTLDMVTWIILPIQ